MTMAVGSQKSWEPKAVCGGTFIICIEWAEVNTIVPSTEYDDQTEDILLTQVSCSHKVKMSHTCKYDYDRV